jgi:biotin transport system substrate-specific component
LTNLLFEYIIPPMKTRRIIYISIFAILTAIGARIAIPLPLVPFTLQTMICMLAGMLLGPRCGAASQGMYMLMGLVGIPVFTGGGGLSSVFMPSFGYIVGFVACAWVTGTLTQKMSANGRVPSVKGYTAAALAGVAAVYILGLVHLYLIVNFWMPGNGMPLMKVLSVGFFSTIGGDIIKAFLSSVIALRIRKTSIFSGI